MKSGRSQVGAGRLFLIAGPCVIESEAHARSMAEAIQRIAADLGIPFIFKASYDKANRTSVKSFRGPGLIEGHAHPRPHRAKTPACPSSPTSTSPHTAKSPPKPSTCSRFPPSSAARPTCWSPPAAPAAPSTSRRASSSRPWDMSHGVEKVRSTGNERVFLTERGSSFGYNNLVVDFRSLAIMRDLAPGGL